MQRPVSLGPIRENRLLPSVHTAASPNIHLYCSMYFPKRRIVFAEYRLLCAASFLFLSALSTLSVAMLSVSPSLLCSLSCLRSFPLRFALCPACCLVPSPCSFHCLTLFILLFSLLAVLPLRLALFALSSALFSVLLFSPCSFALLAVLSSLACSLPSCVPFHRRV